MHALTKKYWNFHIRFFAGLGGATVVAAGVKMCPEQMAEKIRGKL